MYINAAFRIIFSNVIIYTKEIYGMPDNAFDRPLVNASGGSHFHHGLRCLLAD